MGNTNTIIPLLKAGNSWTEVCKTTGASRSTVAYHARKLRSNKSVDPKYCKRYDWAAIDQYAQSHTVNETAAHFGFAKSSWSNWVSEGKVQARTTEKPWNTVAVKNSKYARSSLKRRILQNKLLANACAICGLGASWQGKPLVLILDHIDGVANNHSISNLRLVCPNCNSQLPTHCGRNAKKAKR